MPDILAFNEVGKFDNWYNGKSLAAIQSNKIFTIATSGEITTPNFGEEFQSDKFNWAGVQYDIIVNNPFSEWNDYEYEYENPGIIILSFEYDTLNNFECLKIQGYGLPDCFVGNRTNEFRIDNFEGTTITYSRRENLTATDIEELKLKYIPGFKLKWRYENIADLKNQSTQTYNDKNEEFRRISSYVQYLDLTRNESELQKVWDVVKEIKAQWMETIKNPSSNYVVVFGMNGKTCQNGLERRDCEELMFHDLVSELGNKLNINSSFPIQPKITEDELNIAAQIFIFIMTPQKENWLQWYKKFSYILERQGSLRRVLGNLKKINFFMSYGGRHFTPALDDLVITKIHIRQ